MEAVVFVGRTRRSLDRIAPAPPPIHGQKAAEKMAAASPDRDHTPDRDDTAGLADSVQPAKLAARLKFA